MRVIAETKPSRVRLDWDGRVDDFNQMACQYHNYIQLLNRRERAAHLATHLNVPPDAFRAYLADVARFAFDGDANVTRNELEDRDFNNGFGSMELGDEPSPTRRF